jgi:hypothetical protein
MRYKKVRNFASLILGINYIRFPRSFARGDVLWRSTLPSSSELCCAKCRHRIFHTRTQLQRSATLPSKLEATQVAQQRVTVPPKGHQIQQSNVTRLNDPDSRAQKQVTALLANARPRVQSWRAAETTETAAEAQPRARTWVQTPRGGARTATLCRRYRPRSLRFGVRLDRYSKRCRGLCSWKVRKMYCSMF